MLSLTEFLLARIADDEADVQRTRTSELYVSGEVEAEDALDRLASPDRLQADCEAKRRIVDYRERVARESADTGVPLFEAQLSAYDATLRALALPYADHPDYREEWKP